MPVLARLFEETGLSTILVTNMPFWAEMIGVPRTLAIEYPYGHILGNPGDNEQQMGVITEALKALETTNKPGEIVHSDKKWGEDVNIAMEKWQPHTPSPVISHMSGKVRELIKSSRK